jgi:hypothetical protein
MLNPYRLKIHRHTALPKKESKNTPTPRSKRLGRYPRYFRGQILIEDFLISPPPSASRNTVLENRYSRQMRRFDKDFRFTFSRLISLLAGMMPTLGFDITSI